MQRVDAGPAVEKVVDTVVALCLQDIVTGTAMQDIDSLAAIEDVVAVKAGQAIIATMPVDDVVALGGQRLSLDRRERVDDVVFLRAALEILADGAKVSMS